MRSVSISRYKDVGGVVTVKVVLNDCDKCETSGLETSSKSLKG